MKQASDLFFPESWKRIEQKPISASLARKVDLFMALRHVTAEGHPFRLTELLVFLEQREIGQDGAGYLQWLREQGRLHHKTLYICGQCGQPWPAVEELCPACSSPIDDRAEDGEGDVVVVHDNERDVRDRLRIFAQHEKHRNELGKRPTFTEATNYFFQVAISQSDVHQTIAGSIAGATPKGIDSNEEASTVTFTGSAKKNGSSNKHMFEQDMRDHAKTNVDEQLVAAVCDILTTVNMSTEKPTVWQSGTAGRDVIQVVADQINNSFNRVKDSEAPDDIKQQIETLREQVTELVKGLDEKKAQVVKNKVDAICNEATSPEPDKTMFDVSAKGLGEAASAVLDIAPKIVATLKVLGTLLFGA